MIPKKEKPVRIEFHYLDGSSFSILDEKAEALYKYLSAFNEFLTANKRPEFEWIVEYTMISKDEKYGHVFNKISGILQDKLGVAPAEITPEANLTNDLGADSLDSVEVIMEIEKDFNVSIKDEDWERVKTIDDIVKLILSELRSR